MRLRAGTDAPSKGELFIQMDESSWVASQSAVGGRAELSSHTQTHTRTHAHAPRTAGFIFFFLLTRLRHLNSAVCFPYYFYFVVFRESDCVVCA
jgi:hypothetical protein